ncbi:hypothetical protein [Phenylobacterium sp.]|jgi:hypothetical protein|uniref:hypothetical protein n=1 Tax=Phenylobacterium sp. TaxID=1871053 RepID=UPI002E309383|nr:hypothetical protein [Phenylobacterium sp.]HEX3365841.1 hypothetical protein [Phenylobacterium sp.]
MDEVELLKARIATLERRIAEIVRRHPQLAAEFDELADPRLIPVADWAAMMLGAPLRPDS